MRVAGEARMRAACVSSVLCMRVLVCKARGRAERRHAGKTVATSVCARFSVCTRFSVRNPLKARFLQIGKVWSNFGKISKRKALGHSAKGCRMCAEPHRRAHRSRGSCCSSAAAAARGWMQPGAAHGAARASAARLLGSAIARLGFHTERSRRAQGETLKK